MDSSFVNKVKYKKKRMGVVQKDGKTYIKYMKAHRFRISKNVKYVFIVGFVLVIMGLGIKLLMYELASRPLVEEAAQGIGG